VAQAQLGHLDRRFVQVGLRIDEFSVFGTEVDPAFLPKVGGSWVISDEAFYGDFARWVNSLRLRAAWGTTGRAPGAGAALTTFTSEPSIVGSSVESGAVPLNPGNSDLKPERGIEFEYGLDASFFDERLAVEVTYFDKTTKDLILSQPLPPSLGFRQNPQVNIGEVTNSGLEIALNATAYENDFVRVDVRGGMSTLKNRLVDLGGIAPFGTTNRFTEGFQLGSFVSKRIRSINEATGVVTVADTLEVIGNQFPTLEWTISPTVTLWNQLRISAQFDSKRDFLVLNNTAFFRETRQPDPGPARVPAGEWQPHHGQRGAGRLHAAGRLRPVPRAGHHLGRPAALDVLRDRRRERLDRARHPEPPALEERRLHRPRPRGHLERVRPVLARRLPHAPLASDHRGAAQPDLLRP
jgi:hypothetical protein